MKIETFMVTPEASQAIGEDANCWFNWKVSDDLWRINKIHRAEDAFETNRKLKAMGTKPYLVVNNYRDFVFHELPEDEGNEITVVSWESLFNELYFVMSNPPGDFLSAFLDKNDSICLSLTLKRALANMKDQLRIYFEDSKEIDKFDIRWSALMGGQVVVFRTDVSEKEPAAALAASGEGAKVKQETCSGLIDDCLQYKVRLDYGTGEAMFEFYMSDTQELSKITVHVIWLSDQGDPIKEDQVLLEKKDQGIFGGLKTFIPKKFSQFELRIS